MVRECKISDLALDQDELDRIGLYPSNHIVSDSDSRTIDQIIERIRIKYASKDKVRKKRSKQVVQDREDAVKISSTPLPAIDTIPTPLAKIPAMRVVRRVPRTALAQKKD